MKKALIICLVLLFVAACGGPVVKSSGVKDKNPEYGISFVRPRKATSIAPAKSWATGKKVGVFADSGSIQLAGTIIEGVEDMLMRAGAEVRDVGEIDYKVQVTVELFQNKNYNYNNGYGYNNYGVIRVRVNVTDKNRKKIASGNAKANVFYTYVSDYDYVMESTIMAAGYAAIYGK